MNAVNFFNRRGKWGHLLIGVLMVVMVSIIDFVTDPEITTSIFYLLPVIYLGWFYNEAAGIAAAIIGLVLWLISDMHSNHNFLHPLIPYWNAGVRGAIFLIASFICVRLQSALKNQRLLNEQLAERNLGINRLAKIKSEFASIVSHELRTPLTAIKENLAIVYDGSVGPLTLKQRDFLETAKRNIDRLNRLINDILDFQRLESGRIPFSFQRADLPPIEMDRDRVSQVLFNLVQNAIRYSDQGPIILRTGLSGKRVCFSVEDRGRGISAEEIPKLFQSFQRLSSSVGAQSDGTGLGLAISKRIVDAHQGTIEVDSKPGEGSIFRVFLNPVAEKEIVGEPHRRCG